MPDLTDYTELYQKSSISFSIVRLAESTSEFFPLFSGLPVLT